ncbi:MAG: OmpA family protein [Saprospiraceae bacterium]
MFKHPFFILLFLLALPVTAPGQKLRPPLNGENIVPNPGFERFVGKPKRWFYSGSDFKLGPKYWFSASTASPDAYAPHIRVPGEWAVNSFGDYKPHSGKSMAGITVYGCTNGKPHCREYIEVQLSEPLVKQQHYYVEFWVAPLKKGMHIDKIGAYFSINPIARLTDEILVRTAQVESTELLSPDKPGDWMKVSGFFEATYEAEHIIIGNFNDDDNTTALGADAETFTYAYYYIDDVIVKKVPPFLKVPVKPDDIRLAKLEKGKTFVLQNIYFEFDRYELMPRSYVELHKLVQIMKEHPKLVIELTGHTDSIGTDEYNDKLSVQRATAVVNYLTANGISSRRLVSSGAGERKPIADNETEEGRAKNRRVEFTVLRN